MCGQRAKEGEGRAREKNELGQAFQDVGYLDGQVPKEFEREESEISRQGGRWAERERGSVRTVAET